MPEINDLYQELIIDHSKHPHHYGEMADASCQLEGFNPLCGDRFRLFLKIENDIVTGISFTGQGCAISTASTSLLTDAVLNRPISELTTLIEDFQTLATTGSRANTLPRKLDAFNAVFNYPMRVKCATLSWHTLRQLLEPQPAS